MGKKRNNSNSQRARTRKGAWKAKFIASLSRMGNVTRAAKAAGIGFRTAYDHRESDKAFGIQWTEALDKAADWLEREAWRRAVKGTDKPVFQRGEKVGTIREYSDILLIQLLKANKPKKFRENATVEHTGKDGGTIKTESKQTFDYAGFQRALGTARGGVSVETRLPTENGN